MNRWVLNGALIAAVVGTLIVHALVRPDPTRPNYEFLPEMVRSPAYRSYSPNPVLAEGMTLQPPVPDTLAIDQAVFPYGATAAEAERAGRELKNPLSAKDVEVLRRGAALYATYCQVCHGREGRGDGSVVGHGMPPPPSLLADRAVKMQDGQMYHVLTRGQNNMASYAAQLSGPDRWSVILHVRAIQDLATPLKEKRP